MSLHPAYPVGGCDVSYWQVSINFDTLLDKDIWFIVARASVGTLADTRYQQHKAGAININLPYGAYHYWMPDYSIGSNTDALIAAQPTRPPMGIWLDLEGKNFTVTKQALSEHIYNCLQILDEHYQTKTGLYTRASWWDYWIDSDYYDLIDAASRPLWVAQYFYEFQVAPTAIPISWPEGNIINWQYSAEQGPYAGQASEFGVTGTASLDIDAWLKSEEQFKQFTGAIIAPPPEELPMQIRTKTVANVRNAPDLTAASDIGNFGAGKTMNVIAEIGEFYKVEIYVAESVVEPVIIPPPPTVPEYRVAHDTEYQPQWRGKGVGVPEVFHFDQDAPTPLTKEWQEFIVALNPGISGGGYRSLCKWDRAFTNGTGYDNPNGNLYADFINKRDLTAKLPVVDKVRCCGGAILHGTLNGSIITVETLDGTKPPPSLDWVLDRSWLYFRCYTIAPDGLNHDFPQNGGKPVYFPLVATGKVTVEINKIVPSKPYPYVKRV